MSEPAFDWLVWLKQACKVDPSDEDYMRKIVLAAQWPTCACGQLCKQIPRKASGEPTDAELFDLGVCFVRRIDSRKWSEALKTFRAIEARTTLILNSPKTFNA